MKNLKASVENFKKTHHIWRKSSKNMTLASAESIKNPLKKEKQTKISDNDNWLVNSNEDALVTKIL